MRTSIQFFLLFVMLFIGNKSILAQNIDFTLRYNLTENKYEVFGKSNFSQTNFFVGGGSQLSIVVPSSISDSTLIIETITGGLWTDNSQIYAPSATPLNDYHGIASNGSLMEWVFEVETLLFTFQISNKNCVEGIRLFENNNDPPSNEPSMNGSDFKNYFSNALTLENLYKTNYQNEGTSCSKPVVTINPITTTENLVGNTCAIIFDPDANDTHTASICKEAKNGEVVINLTNNTHEICIRYNPNSGFTGTDSVCVEVCDQTGLCVEEIVLIIVDGNNICNNQIPPVVSSNSPICKGDLILLETNDLGSGFTYVWTNVNGNTIGEGASLPISSENEKALPPFQVTRTEGNCPSVISNLLEVELFDISTISPTNSGPACSGNPIQLFANGIEGATYNWYLKNSNEIIAKGSSPIINNLTVSTTFDLEVIFNECTIPNRLQTTVIIDPKPNISNLPMSITACRGEDIVLTAISQPSMGQEVGYFWLGPDGFRYENNTTSDSFQLILEGISPEQAGSYSLELSTKNGCKTTPYSVIINVADELEAPRLIPLQNIVCSGNPIELTASLQKDADVEFEWYLQNEKGDLFLLNITNYPSIVFDNPTSAQSGKYLVRVSNNGCISGFSNTEIINVLDATSNLSAKNTSSLANQICEGDFIQLSAPFYESATYQWFGPAGFTSDKYNPFINPVTSFDAGEYFAVINIDGCVGIRTAATTVYINSKHAPPTIISNSPICEGENLEIEISSELDFQPNAVVKYLWYNLNTNALIAETNQAKLQIDAANSSNSGDYYVIISVNGCQTEVSNTQNIQVASHEELVAYVGNDIELCTAAEVALNAIEQKNASGIWSSPTGAIFTKPKSATSIASNLISGENIFIWSLQDACGQAAIDTLHVEISHTTNDIANAGLDQSICEASGFQLNASQLEEAIGLWTQDIDQANQGIVIENPNEPTSNINGLAAGNVYQFTWTISNGVCQDFASDQVFVTINEKPEEVAFISQMNKFQSICEGNQTDLSAETPFFSTGKWSSFSSAFIVNPASPQTMIGDLDPGINTFVWSLSNEACVNFSSDTIIIYQESEIAANADEYTIRMNDSLTFDVFENDDFFNLDDLTFTITKYPNKGILKEESDGRITYISNKNYFGPDDFRYKLCSDHCQEICDTAIVNLTVNGSSRSGACFIPNIISPNGDNINDQFRISCLANFPDASIKIFNRWGDKIYEAAPYLNDWNGTYKNRQLPSGTYYYTLQLKVNGDPIQDFITIFR